MINYKILLTFLLLIVFSYCGKHIEGGLSGGGGPDATRDHLTTSSWRITTYANSYSVNQTSELAEYTFVFTKYGTVKATQALSSIDGTWGTR